MPSMSTLLALAVLPLAACWIPGLPAGVLPAQFEMVGCFPRSPADADDPHDYHDKTCASPEARAGAGGRCRSGLPFFRVRMEEGQSHLDCAAFCLSKGLDLSGEVAASAGAWLECRCGATAGNLPAWHEKAAPQGLLLPNETVAGHDPNCAVLVWRYAGPMDNSGVPFAFLQLSVSDEAYLDEVAEGLDHVYEEDEGNSDGGVEDDLQVSTDDLQVSNDDLGVVLASGLCRDSASSGLLANDRQLPCSEAGGFCSQFPSVRGNCPVTCGQCSPAGGWRSCYPRQCASGGPWLTKSGGVVRVNYFFTAGLDEERRRSFRMAIQQWEAKTCIRFRESSRTPRIEVGVTDPNSCSATIGWPGQSGTSRINLGWCNSRRHVGSMIHEIGHSMGMSHEQQRSDAASALDTPAGRKGPYLRVFWGNIPDILMDQYIQDSKAYIGSVSAGYVEYDYQSIMHYGSHIGGSVVLETVSPIFRSVVGSRAALTQNDVRQVLDMYQCSAPSSPPAAMPAMPAVRGACVDDPAYVGPFEDTCETWVGWRRSGFRCESYMRGAPDLLSSCPRACGRCRGAAAGAPSTPAIRGACEDDPTYLGPFDDTCETWIRWLQSGFRCESYLQGSPDLLVSCPRACGRC